MLRRNLCKDAANDLAFPVIIGCYLSPALGMAMLSDAIVMVAVVFAEKGRRDAQPA